MPRGFLPPLVGAVLLSMLTVTMPLAHASTTTEISPANGSTTCPTIGGTWNSITNTCTVSNYVTVGPGDTLQIDAGVILIISPAALRAREVPEGQVGRTLGMAPPAPAEAQPWATRARSTTWELFSWWEREEALVATDRPAAGAYLTARMAQAGAAEAAGPGATGS